MSDSIKNFFKKAYQVAIAAIKGFNSDECYLKASALTFYSLLSIVPSLAVTFGIAKGFGFQAILEKELRDVFREQREVTDYIIYFVYRLLEEAQGNVIAGVGIVALLWTVLKLLESIEHSLNDIWKVRIPRTYPRKFADYFATLFFSIFFLVAASSITIFVISTINSYVDHSTTLKPIFSFSFVYLLPLGLSCALFTFLYVFMPNTRVPYYSALIAGIIAGTSYQVVQWIYIKFQIGVSSYGAIYGSFAALPLFLIWIHTSWLITLMGGELAYYIDKYSPIFTQTTKQVKTSESALAILTVMASIRKFYEKKPPLSTKELSKALGITLDVSANMLQKLHKADVLAVSRVNQAEGYQPAIPLENISLKYVLDAYYKVDEKQISVKISDDLNMVEATMKELHTLTGNSKANVLLKDLIAKT